MPAKMLYRSRDHAMIGGVCSGIAEYFDTDPSLIRLVTVLLLFAGGVGILGYVVAWIIIPQRPLRSPTADNISPESSSAPARVEEQPETTNRPRMVLGIALIVIGFLFLLGTLSIWHWFSFFRLWPIILIIIGIMIIAKGMDRGESREN